ncbi:MAG TPA: hypothetical protein VF318_08710, partial [Dehalococcoidales bacterium]
ADERMRRLFEPKAPTIATRIKAMEELQRAGIRTFVMIAPLLPGAERLDEVLTGKVDRVLIDKMNYFYADWVYRKNHLVDKLTPEFFAHVSGELCAAFEKQGVECSSFC